MTLYCALTLIVEFIPDAAFLPGRGPDGWHTQQTQGSWRDKLR